MIFSKTTLNNTKKTLLCFVLGTPLIACAGAIKKDNDNPDFQEQNIADFRFSLPGNRYDIPTVINKKNGQLLVGKKISDDLSIKATSIEEIKTITIIRARGSHYMIVSIGGVNYRYDYSH